MKQCGGLESERKRDCMAEPPPVPETLLVLESCILDGIDVTDLMHMVPIERVAQWEGWSMILAEGVTRMNWWETCFKDSFPVTYSRICSCSNEQLH
jgi:hypothetical protein